jgi:O-antigen/teichoic acid export membrane protein
MTDESPFDLGLSVGSRGGRGKVDRRLAMNAIWLFAGQTTALAAGIFVVAVTSRTFGAGDFGQLRLAQALAALVIVVGDLGLSGLAIRQIARDPAAVADYGWPVIALRALVTVPVAAATVAVVGLAGSADATIVAVVLLTAVAAASNVTYVFIAMEEAAAISRLRIVSQVVLVAAVVLGALVVHSLLAVAAALVLAATVNAGPPLQWASRRKFLSRSAPTRSSARHLLQRGVPFLGSALAIQVVLNGSTIVLGAVKGTGVLGLFAAPYALASYALLLGGAIMGAAYPRIASHWVTREHTKSLMTELCAVMGVLGIGIAVSMFVLADQALPFLFGDEFAGQAPVLRLLTVIPLLGYLNMTLGQAMVAQGSERMAMGVAWASAGISVIVAIVATPTLGGVGAALAAVAAEVVALAGYVIAMLDRESMAYVRSYAAELPVALLIGLVLFGATLVGAPFPLAVALGVAAFAVLAWIGGSTGLRALVRVIHEGVS